MAACICFAGCGEKLDENRPLDEVRAEAQKLDSDKLQKQYELWRKHLDAKLAQADSIARKISDMPLDKVVSEDMQKLKQEYSAADESCRKSGAILEVYAGEMEKKFSTYR